MQKPILILSIIDQLETSSKSLYLLTLFLNTCLVTPILFAISSDFVLLSFSSIRALVMSLLRVVGDGVGDGEFSAGDRCFLIGSLSFNCKVPLWPFRFARLSLFFVFPFLSVWLLFDEEELEEFCDFSLVSSF